ncbi:DNA cytosine methyltransferase [Flectobacillus sp. BAB-3569]|uniref:DNA cytosine methyltransferase n=1 Tax=Flectobacillus sp. BAB-3569 TaxID=1509483 RepID=UPI000BA46932|nr:DNA cytosine methyltransferase [Flectobacillus sp. BAB-3569]PAC27835.1 DNA cytosine methyltransferase [Flectobacillus sp. BAB-3569]
MKESEVKFIIVDLFCGAGGTTTGFDMANDAKGNKIAKVIACVNHDAFAIKSHWQNHPDVVHFEEDILVLDLTKLIKVVQEAKKRYPNAKLVLWASLECTNFSNAKGGQPRDADSRTLAWGLIRYLQAIAFDYVMIENVSEFQDWGPLDANNKPIKELKGIDFQKWCSVVDSMGFYNQWTKLNSADFGASTSRKRLFGCFARFGMPIVFPEPTHAKKSPNLKPWNAVKHCLDFEDEGKSIFQREKPLVDSSLERILAGLKKHIIAGDSSFILKYNSMNKAGKHKPPSIHEPCHTIACQGRLGLVQASFIAQYYSGKPEGKVKCSSEPIGAITTVDHHSLCNVFMFKYHGNEKGAMSIEQPCSTITTKDRLAKVQVQHWLDKSYSGPENHQSVEAPAGTIMTVDKHQLASAFLINPSHGGHSHNIEKPCPVIIARQDKAPLYLITAVYGEFAIPIYDDDSEVMISIKQLMAQYGIVDIKTRMLKVQELKIIQGFPADYVLHGNQSKQKKFIGNSVVPIVVKVWIEAIHQELIQTQKAKKAA